jgi:transposase
MEQEKATPEEEALARKRASVIWRVRSGEITATEGARLLCVSRKTYYEWEARALEGMVEGLRNGDAGRPPLLPDPEKETLRKDLERLQKENARLKQSAEVRAVFDRLNAYEQQRRRQNRSDGLKKNRPEEFDG